MAHITVVVNGDTLMNADPGDWTTNPPDINALGFRGRGNQPEPWRQLIMLTIAETATLALAGKPGLNTSIDVTTRAGGWTMNMEQT